MNNYEKRVQNHLAALRLSIKISENSIHENEQAIALDMESITLDLEAIASAENELADYKKSQETQSE